MVAAGFGCGEVRRSENDLDFGMGERADWVESLAGDGYCHFSGLVDGATVAAARAQIDRDLAENYDPARKEECDSRTFCPGDCVDLFGWLGEYLGHVDSGASWRSLLHVLYGHVWRVCGCSEDADAVGNADGF